MFVIKENKKISEVDAGICEEKKISMFEYFFLNIKGLRNPE